MAAAGSTGGETCGEVRWVGARAGGMGWGGVGGRLAGRGPCLRHMSRCLPACLPARPPACLPACVAVADRLPSAAVPPPPPLPAPALLQGSTRATWRPAPPPAAYSSSFRGRDPTAGRALTSSTSAPAQVRLLQPAPACGSRPFGHLNPPACPPASLRCPCTVTLCTLPSICCPSLSCCPQTSCMWTRN